MMKQYFLVCIGLFSLVAMVAQTPWDAHVNESIPWDDASISYGAASVAIERGYINHRDTNATFTQDSTTSNRAFAGQPKNAVGLTQNVVSLGDFGQATLQFNPPIGNSTGSDFAVFENGFNAPGEGKYFLELAHVAVSSDGQRFVFFPANSYTQTTEQVASFEGIAPENLENLAGCFPHPYGTGFDLSLLQDCTAININRITHVRLVDVCGDINAPKNSDTRGTPINDPYPTAFHSGGFDLMAVGVIHASTQTVDNMARVAPNPVAPQQKVQLLWNEPLTHHQWVSASGKILSTGGSKVSAPQQSGSYFLKVQSATSVQWIKVQVE